MANPANPLFQDGRALRRLLIVLGLLAVAAARLDPVEALRAE